MRSLAALPKTDLHVHFQGSARATLVAELEAWLGAAPEPRQVLSR